VLTKTGQQQPVDALNARAQRSCHVTHGSLQGNVKVVVGKENLEFTSGPFAFYGANALKMTSSNPSSGSPVHKGARRGNSETFFQLLSFAQTGDIEQAGGRMLIWGNSAKRRDGSRAGIVLPPRGGGVVAPCVKLYNWTIEDYAIVAMWRQVLKASQAVLFQLIVPHLNRHTGLGTSPFCSHFVKIWPFLLKLFGRKYFVWTVLEILPQFACGTTFRILNTPILSPCTLSQARFPFANGCNSVALVEVVTWRMMIIVMWSIDRQIVQFISGTRTLICWAAQ